MIANLIAFGAWCIANYQAISVLLMGIGALLHFQPTTTTVTDALSALRSLPMLPFLKSRIAALLAANPSVSTLTPDHVSALVEQIIADLASAGALPTTLKGWLAYLTNLSGKLPEIEADIAQLVAMIAPATPAVPPPATTA